jgi:hypothetical protein
MERIAAPRTGDGSPTSITCGWVSAGFVYAGFSRGCVLTPGSGVVGGDDQVHVVDWRRARSSVVQSCRAYFFFTSKGSVYCSDVPDARPRQSGTGHTSRHVNIPKASTAVAGRIGKAASVARLRAGPPNG